MMEEDARNVKIFTKIYTLTQIVGILCIGLLVVWLAEFRGGFGWQSTPSLQFNWHPILMVLGFVILYGNGILVYRAFRAEEKRKLKIAHATFNIISLIFVVIGLKAVFDSHNLNKDADGSLKPIPNMYSLHSWIGLSVVILFATQWLFGLLTFLAPGFRASLRAFYLPIHQWFGLAIFVGAVGTALMGLTEKAIFSVSDYSSKSAEGVLLNIVGLLIVIFCGLVVFLVSNSKYQRRATEDELLLADAPLN